MNSSKILKKIKNELSPNDFDDEGNLKPSLFVYICFAYLCKAFIVIIMAFASIAHETKDIISLVYPAHEDFYFDIIIGVIALLVLFVFIKKKSLAVNVFNKNLVAKTIKFGVTILLTLKLCFLLYGTFMGNSISPGIVIEFTFSCYFLINYLGSAREKLFRAEV